MNKEDLKAIEQQLTYALDELQNDKPDIDLLHDWISDPLRRVKKLIIPDVVKSFICDAEEKGGIRCETQCLGCDGFQRMNEAN